MRDVFMIAGKTLLWADEEQINRSGIAEIPEGVEKIGINAFFGCYNLQEVHFPSTLKEIRKEALEGTALKKVDIPDGVRIIEESAFSHCEELKEINLPSSIEEIGREAFYDCKKLKSLIIPACKLKSCVGNMNDLEYFNAKDFGETDLFDLADSPKLQYFADTEDGFVASKDPIPAAKCYKLNLKELDSEPYHNLTRLDISRRYYPIPVSTELEILSKFSHYDPKTATILLEIANDYMSLDKKTHTATMQDYVRLCDRKQQKFLLNLVDVVLPLAKPKDENGLVDTSDKATIDDCVPWLSVLLKMTGALEPQPITVQKTTKSGTKQVEVNYAQKTSEFFKEQFLTKKLDYSTLTLLLEDFEGAKEFNPEFADFILNEENFEKILKHHAESPSFLMNIYTLFEDVQKTNTKNTGSQRQLAPTVEKFVEYFDNLNFEGVTEETRPLAETVHKYFLNQSTFDKALKIHEEYKKVGKTGILEEHIVEEKAKNKELEKLELLSAGIKKEAIDAAETLVGLASENFTYDWLLKNDPQNYILGKLCNCCSHIEGNGHGIMRASIVHPDVQNLVIRNKKGEIVAKSTLYINRKEGYGVCNNVEVKESLSASEKDGIYLKFKLGLAAMADEYNKANPQAPLKQINVGMNANDLKSQITRYDKEGKVLEALDYSLYGDGNHNHAGDSSFSQYVVWKNTKSSARREK